MNFLKYFWTTSGHTDQEKYITDPISVVCCWHWVVRLKRQIIQKFCHVQYLHLMTLLSFSRYGHSSWWESGTWYLMLWCGCEIAVRCWKRCLGLAGWSRSSSSSTPPLIRPRPQLPSDPLLLSVSSSLSSKYSTMVLPLDIGHHMVEQLDRLPQKSCSLCYSAHRPSPPQSPTGCLAARIPSIVPSLLLLLHHLLLLLSQDSYVRVSTGTWMRESLIEGHSWEGKSTIRQFL